MSNNFFVFEGGEGSGKSTAITLVKEILTKEYNLDVITTREPGGVKVSEDIRNIIFDNNISAKSEALLFASARNEHLNNIILPALNDNKIVLCDRYIISSLVYQGIARELGVEEVLKINDFATNKFYPKVSFFFDIKPEIALKRLDLDSSREINRFDKEGINFHNKLYKGYKSTINKLGKSVTVDANLEQKKLARTIVEYIIKEINE